jgi:hypothetical protein
MDPEPAAGPRARGHPRGTLCWMGDSDTFIELLDFVDIVYPPVRGHIVMDNRSAQDTPDVNEWFDEPLVVDASLHLEACVLAQSDRALVHEQATGSGIVFLVASIASNGGSMPSSSPS